MVAEPWLFALLYVIGLTFGLRGSVRLSRRYVAVRDRLDARESLILLAIAVVAWVITVAAFYYGGLAVRRLLGYESIPELVPVSALVAIAILFIPTFLEAVVDRVARVPWR